MIGNLMSRMGMAEKLSIPQLQQAIQDGTLPAYVGVPLLQQKVQQAKQAQSLMAQPQPTIAQQVMGEAQGIEQAQSNLPAQGFAPGGIVGMDGDEYAGGGMVAFANRGLVADDQEDMPELDDEDLEDYELSKLFPKDRFDKLAAESAGIAGLSPEVNLTQAEQNFGIRPESASGQGIRAEAKAPRGIEALSFQEKIKQLESGGRHYDKAGNILTSSKGAEGIMQVMPNTQRDPGFGVTPAKDRSAAELERVGRDYANAMLRRYGDEKLAAMAYNWGPGNVDKWIAGGMKGEVPKETRQYAANFAQGGIAHFDVGGGPIAVDPSGTARLPNYPVATVPQAPGSTIPTSRSLVPYQGQASQGIEALSPWEKYIAPIFRGFGKDVAGAGRFGVNPATVIGSVGYELSSGAANALSNATDEQLDQLANSGMDDTALAAAIMSQGRKNEVKKEEVKAKTEKKKEEAPPVAEPPAPAVAPIIEKKTADIEDPVAIKMRERILKGIEDAKAEGDQNKYLALLQAGLKMMGGTSPYAAANIGAGGAEGVATYAALQQATKKDLRDLQNQELALYKYEQYAKERGEARNVREAAALRDDLTQYQKNAYSTILAKYKNSPEAMKPGFQEKVQAELDSFLATDPIYKELRKRAYPNLPEVQSTQKQTGPRQKELSSFNSSNK